MLLNATAARRGVTRIERLSLHHGGELRDAAIAYGIDGPADAPVVVALGGISAGRDVGGWWPEQVGAGRALDTRRFRVLGIDYLGGSGASTGPRTGPFPAVSSFDQASALAAVLDELGIARVHTFVGSSYGGMVALAFASRFSERVAQLLVISAAHEPQPMATALRSLQRRTIRLGIEHGCVEEAVGIARGIAMTTYRTSAEFAHRFAAAAHRDDAGFRFPVEEYLAHCGETYAQRYSPWGFLCLSESIDLHRVDPANIHTPTTLLAVESDTLVPTWQVRALAAALGGATRLVSIPSLYGHDAFLKESTAVSGIIRDTLASGAAQ